MIAFLESFICLIESKKVSPHPTSRRSKPFPDQGPSNSNAGREIEMLFTCEPFGHIKKSRAVWLYDEPGVSVQR